MYHNTIMSMYVFAEGWSLKKDDERRLEAAERWCYGRMLRISWTEKGQTRAY